MYKSFINHQIGLFFKQIEYRYITFKSNRAIERSFVYSSPIRPFARTIAFTKNHSLLMTLSATGLISMSLMALLKPVTFSKPVPLRLELDKKIEKKLANLPPAHLLKKQEDGLNWKLPDNSKSQKAAIENKGLMSSKTSKKAIFGQPHSIVNKQVPANITISREDFLNKTPNFTLLVNKRTKKLLVTEEKENGYLIIEEFPVSLALNSGDKKFKGDKKTPEGTYALVDFKTDDELPDMYGPYAAVLNYPNKEDLKHGKTGSGIWIHGTGKNQLTPDTQGCVELSDKNMIKLYSYISKGTKIIITPENIDLTPKKNLVHKNLLNFAASS